MPTRRTSRLAQLLGRRFVLHGGFYDGHRQRLQRMIEAQQGIVDAELSAQTDYLLLANLSGSKLAQKRAAAINSRGGRVQVIDIPAFERMAQVPADVATDLLRRGQKGMELLERAVGQFPRDYRGLQPPPAVSFQSENFDGVALADFILEEVYFYNCSFKGAKLTNVRFRRVSNCDFSGASLTGCHFSHFEGCRFHDCTMDRPDFHGEMDGVDFSRSVLTGAEFHSTDESSPEVSFAQSTLRSTYFASVKLDRPNFEGADMTSAKVSHCCWQSAILRSANLAHSLWGESELPNADFSRADLRRADFGVSDLTGAKFNGANLEGAILQDANLDGADLAGAVNFSAASTAGIAGPCVAEFDAVTRRSGGLRFTVEIERADGEVDKAGFDSERMDRAWGGILPESLRCIYSNPPGQTPASALLQMAARIRDWEIRFETLEVKGTKSPCRPARLHKIVLKAIAEACGRRLPPQGSGAETKAHDEKAAERESAKRDRKQAELRLKRKRDADLRREIARKIRRAVGPIADLESFLGAVEWRLGAETAKKALRMLKSERLELFNVVAKTYVNGVVRSPADRRLLYVCRIQSNGTYACCSKDLHLCKSLVSSSNLGPCKHLMALIIHLVKEGRIDPATMDSWIARSPDAYPEPNREIMGGILLRYQGAETGEVDWRPAETVPEDYYTV